MTEKYASNEINIRKAVEQDITDIGRLLLEVHKVHSDARPDLFRKGSRKYTDAELKAILKDNTRPVFVAAIDGQVAGYAFCIHQQHINDNNLTDIKTLYIDDLCVEEDMRGRRIGTLLYDYVIDFAKENGYYNVTLNVWADNKKALKFYESLDLKIQKIGMEKIL
jgi:ribosomal protein S18 acetylase RimI-like enzyme